MSDLPQHDATTASPSSSSSPVAEVSSVGSSTVTVSSSLPAKPPLLNLAAYHEYSRSCLAPAVFAYYDSGAGDERTLQDNTAAFARLLLRPRCLVDVSAVSTAASLPLLHHAPLPLAFPVCISPTAMQRMAHPDGEEATARAAAGLGTVMALSTISNSSIEAVMAAAAAASFPSSPPLVCLQLYVYNDRELTASLVRRAEAAGCRALVLTVDTPVIGVRDREVQAGFQMPAHLQLANFSLPALRNLTLHPVGRNAAADPLGRSSSFSWRDLRWLQSVSSLPLLLKGVLTAEDALQACRSGVSALIVSNHGGRQLDGALAAVDALPEVVQAVRQWEQTEGAGQGRVGIAVDGGIRRGSDVFKALALGADCAFVGRPVLHGLSYAGEQGVRQVMAVLRQELEVCMALTGCASIAAIDRSRVTSRAEVRQRLSRL